MKDGATQIRRIASSLTLLIAGILLSIAVAEISLRLFFPQTLLSDPDAFVPDPVLGSRLIPGFSGVLSTPEYNTRWEINRHGHRGPEAGARIPGRCRVAFLGDSFTFGYGVEESEAYPRVLEALLEARWPERFETINLGVGGYGTGQEVAWLEENLARGLRPDLVVLGLYVGNDLDETVNWAAGHAAPSGSDQSGRAPEAASGVSRIERLRHWLGTRSHLYNFVSDRGNWLLVKLRLRSVVYFVEVDALRKEPSPDVDLGWRLVKEQLTELGKLAEQGGFRAMIMLIPMRHQVVPSSWEQVKEYYRRLSGSELEGFDLDLPSRQLGEFCAETGLPLLDLTGPFRADPDPARLYFRRDQHWTREGHALAAHLLAPFIQEQSSFVVGPNNGRDGRSP